MKSKSKLSFLIAACLSTIVLAIVNSSFGTMLAPITENYLDGEGASRGYPNSAMQIGCIAAVLVLALLGGKLKGSGKLILLAVSAFVMSAGMFFLGGEPTLFAVFVGVFAIVGLAYGTIDVISSALVADVYGEGASSMMCLLHGSHGAAGIVAPIVVSFVLSRAEKWTRPYTVIGIFVVCVLAYLVILYAFARNRLPEASAKTDSPSVGFDKALLPTALAIGFYGVYLVGMICYTESYEEHLSLGGSGKAMTLSLLYLGLTACRLLLPAIQRTCGITPRTYLTFSPFVSAAILFIGVVSGNATVYIIFSALSSLIAGAFIPIAISAACEIMSGNTTGASTYMNLAMLIGNSVASPLLGAIGGACGIGVGMLIPPAALIICGVCAAFSNRKKKAH